MDRNAYTQANRVAWNEVTPIHQRERKVDLKEKFKKKGYSTLDEAITTKFQKLGIQGKPVAQLCCNNGRETLSLINLGAASRVGFDISDAAIEEARGLAETSGLNCEFVRTDVYDIGEEYTDRFDLIYLSIGGIVWLPDLDAFFSIVRRLLKNHGLVVIYDSHPVTNILGAEGDEEFDPSNPLKPVFSYFREEPWISNNGIDYIGKTSYKSETMYSFTQPMSMVISGLGKMAFTCENCSNSLTIYRVYLVISKGRQPFLCLIFWSEKNSADSCFVDLNKNRDETKKISDGKTDVFLLTIAVY
ncbi:MAG: hypothetical protein B6244_09515 [Candidatus Cloacimonetes bacterium 4572_55]|nr:MAG: hypothetical protein B6244_09515 [Candidatus Cloacimonetes bacterium 4572_55]